MQVEILFTGGPSLTGKWYSDAGVRALDYADLLRSLVADDFCGLVLGTEPETLDRVVLHEFISNHFSLLTAKNRISVG